MKKYCLLMILVLILTGCGKKNEAAAPEEAAATASQDMAETDENRSEGEEEEDAAEAAYGENDDDDTSGEGVMADSDEAAADLSDEKAAENDEEETDTDEYETEPVDPAVTMFTNTGINVRSGPSADKDKVGFLKAGAEILVTGKVSNGWYEIEYNGGKSFVSGDYVSAEAPEPAPEEAPADLDAGSPAEAPAPSPAPGENNPAVEQTPVQPAPAPTPAPAPVVTAPAGVLLIGDSRCVMMKAATEGGGVSWICENGKGYDWMMETAIPRADGIVGKGTRVVFCLGVNDTDHAWSYSREINAIAAKWAQRGAATYFVSVNPVWANPYTTEEDVTAFNATMMSSLSGVRYINTHDTLTAEGYTIVDGLHYDDETSIRIFNHIIAGL